MLLFEKEFGDAIFHVEFRYVRIEGKSGYNSGVYIRNSRDGAIWHGCNLRCAPPRIAQLAYSDA